MEMFYFFTNNGNVLFSREIDEQVSALLGIDCKERVLQKCCSGLG